MVNGRWVLMKIGLNKLAGFDITEFKLLGEDAPDGTNTKGTVYIPNPTVMTISMVPFPIPHLYQRKHEYTNKNRAT